MHLLQLGRGRRCKSSVNHILFFFASTIGNNANHETGAFAEYVIAKGDVQLKIPDRLSFEEAATLGVGITTVGQGLYQSLGLPLPDQPAEEKFPILIFGGSTATGTIAIQFAKL